MVVSEAVVRKHPDERNTVSTGAGGRHTDVTGARTRNREGDVSLGRECRANPRDAVR